MRNCQLSNFGLVEEIMDQLIKNNLFSSSAWPNTAAVYTQWGRSHNKILSNLYTITICNVFKLYSKEVWKKKFRKLVGIKNTKDQSLFFILIKWISKGISMVHKAALQTIYVPFFIHSKKLTRSNISILVNLSYP